MTLFILLFVLYNLVYEHSNFRYFIKLIIKTTRAVTGAVYHAYIETF